MSTTVTKASQAAEATRTKTISLEGPAYQNFIESLHTDRTRQEYTRLLADFAKWKNIYQIEDLVSRQPTSLKADLIRYLTYLKKDRQLSYYSRNGVLCAIKHFCEMNDIVLPWAQISKFVGGLEKSNEDREYTYEEIAKLLSIADLKYKAIILLMASSGIRVGAIPSLRIRDLTKVSNYDIFKIVVYRKTRDEYYTFCTPECYDAVTEYLEYRKRFGEVLSPDSPLFRHDFNQNDRSTVKDARPMAYPSLKIKVRALLIKSGIAKYQSISETNRNGKRRNEVAANHGLRKYCITQMGRSKMDSEIREMLVGHKLGVRGVYLKYGEADRLNEYLKAVDHLTVNQENTLKRHNEELRVRSETNEYIINHRLQEKELEVKSLQEKYEQDMKAMREEMENKFQQILTRIDTGKLSE